MKIGTEQTIHCSLAELTEKTIVASESRRHAGGMKKGCLIALGSIAGVMVLGIGGCIFVAMQYEKEHPELRAGSDAVLAVEKQVMSFKGADGLGNNDEARKMADDFAKVMRSFREGFITGTDSKGFSLTKGHFVTHCTLTSDKCAFVVHVPDLRHYADDAKQAVRKMAWSLAARLVRERHPEVKQLAVGVHGVMNFEIIIVGTPGTGDKAPPLIKEETSDSEVLYPFLTEGAAAVPAKTTGQKQ